MVALLSSYTSIVVLLSAAGLSSAFRPSTPAHLLTKARRHKKSLQQPQPIWINDAPTLQHCSRKSSLSFSSRIINDDEQIDDDNASSPTLRKRDKIRLLMKSISNFILRLQSRLNTTKTIVLSLLLSWFIGSWAMDHSGFQIIRKPVHQQTAPAIENVAFSEFLNYCEQNGWQKQFTRSSSIIEKVKVDTTTKQLEYTIRTNDRRDAALSTAMIAQTDYSLMDKSELVKFMRRNNVDFEAGTVTGGGSAATATTSTTQKSTDGIATLALLFAAYKLFYAQSSSSPLGGGMLSSKDSIGKLAKKKGSSSSSDVTTSFDDIHGIDNAKHDVMELVDSLRYPEKYRLVGARAPKGILLEGPPGCGKTTLARACANLADVPLIYCSGSDFVETYVGKGAARIRQLFAQARSVTKTKGSSSSCLIFIDEIDAIGKARSSGGSSGNISNGSSDEAEQTLNALLTQMDGLGEKDNDGIFVLAATNRRELLDPALVRSGRFDRLIKVELPNSHGRYEILRSHARKLPGFMEGDGIDIDRPNSLGVGNTIDLNAVAAVTDGCSGADLEQIINEAAIRTVRRVGAQLKHGVSRDEVDVTILPEDMEESVNSFFQSRAKPQRQSPLKLTPWGT